MSLCTRRIKMEYFLRIRAICFLFSLIFSIFILTLSSIEYGRTYRFYSGFLCYRKDSESYIRWFQQEWLPSWPINGDRVFACLDCRIRICMFFMFLSFYRRLSDCLVRAEGTPWDKGGLSFSVTLSGWQSRRQRDMLLSLLRIIKKTYIWLSIRLEWRSCGFMVTI